MTNNNDRKEINYNKLVGKIDDTFYFLDYTFIHSDTFKGATGSELRPVSKEEYEERMSIESLTDSYAEIWRQEVQNENTTEGLDEWIEGQNLGEENVFDLSYFELWEQIRALGFSEEEYPVIECVGGGRCFSKNMKFDEVFAPELIEIINQFEEEEKKNETN